MQAADILGLHPRSMRRWRARYEAGGAGALYDKQTQRPSRRQAPAPEMQRILRLYRERFRGWNVRHFYRFARQDHASSMTAISVWRSGQPPQPCSWPVGCPSPSTPTGAG